MSKDNIYDVNRLIPHKKPFLFLDKILFIDYIDLYLIGYKLIRSEDTLGHFPLKPIMPGVLLLESMAQASLCLTNALFRQFSIVNVKSQDVLLNKKCNLNFSLENNYYNNQFYLSSIDNIKFRRVTVPGDSIIVVTKLFKSKMNFYTFECKIDFINQPPNFITCDTQVRYKNNHSSKYQQFYNKDNKKNRTIFFDSIDYNLFSCANANIGMYYSDESETN